MRNLTVWQKKENARFLREVLSQLNENGIWIWAAENERFRKNGAQFVPETEHGEILLRKIILKKDAEELIKIT